MFRVGVALAIGVLAVVVVSGASAGTSSSIALPLCSQPLLGSIATRISPSIRWSRSATAFAFSNTK